MYRRGFLRAAAGAPLALLARAGRCERTLPPPGESGIEHLVVVTLENRSFDHFLGWLPNADGKQSGLQYPDTAGTLHATYELRPDYTGCSHRDPDHSYEGGRVQLNHGAADGWLRASDIFSIGYYTEQDLPFLAALARHYTTLDRYFCSVLGPTIPNRIFQFAAQTDRLTNTTGICVLPTIFDRLAEARISTRYYYGNLPIVTLWGLKYVPLLRRFDQFLADTAAGELPAVSFVDPIFTIGNPGNDDHPPADVRAGDAFMAQVFHAVAAGPRWNSTVLVFNFDEWGGFFDHVPPPRAVAPNGTDPDVVDGKALLGFRVPAVIASPFSRGDPADPRVSSLVCDHTSVLKFIEWRWSVGPLTARDASDDVNNLAAALDFTSFRPGVPDLPAPDAPPAATCEQTAPSPPTGASR